MAVREYQSHMYSEALTEVTVMQAAQIAVRLVRGHMVVYAMGRTPRGQSYIKGQKALNATGVRDPDFRREMDEAVKELLGSEA